MRLGKSQREKEVKRVASIAAYNAEGLLLFGKRSDNSKWTLPGGHLEPGEEPMEAAKRELEEETGLLGQDFQYLGRGLGGIKNDIIVYCYKCIVDGSPDSSEDPDEECEEWRWVEPEEIPEEITENLHSPKNISLRLLGLQEGEVEEPMTKADPHFVEFRPYEGKALKIPKLGTRSRKKYDAQHIQDIAVNFAGGDISRLRPVQIPLEEHMGGNQAVNKSRLKLYQRMLKAKDRLPPVVVKRVGLGYHLLDGNHRVEAAKLAGHQLMHAVEILDPPLRKAPYDDASWTPTEANEYVGNLGLKPNVRKHLNSTQLSPKFWIHEYRNGVGGGHRTFHVTTTPVPTHENPKSVIAQYRGQTASRSDVLDNEGFRIDATVVHPDYQRQGLSSLVYKHLGKKFGGKLFSGGSQSPEARKLWESFTKDPNVQVKFGQSNSYEPHEMTFKSEGPKGAIESKVGEFLGMTVYEVDGPYLRNNVDIEFTEGGNHGRYSWIPEGEIWLERTEDTLDMIACAVHEYHERKLMSAGMDYDKAHDQSSTLEHKFRTEFADHEADEPELETAASWYKQQPQALQKGFGGALLAGTLALGAQQPKPIEPPKPAIHELAQQQGMPKWTPEGLHPDMFPIAHLESSWGKNMAHATHSKGDFHTAYGALGFKPITGHEEYTKSKFMQKQYPNLSNTEEFLKRFKNDSKFYNLLASAHFARLKHRHGSPEKAAYAWRYGTGATAAALEEKIKNNAYVQKYLHMNLHQKQGQETIKKSEQHDPLEAMLQHDNPQERIMALKSKACTPYHLRLALQDEDPDVREAAVKHPLMTSSLIEEALKHPDLHTREAALSRPDLQEHHLEQAIWDPDLQTQASRHPALTEEQRKKLVGANDTPEGLKDELLAKTIGYLTYPKLGQPTPDSTPFIRDPKLHEQMTNLRGGKEPLEGFVSYNAARNKSVNPSVKRVSASIRSNLGSAFLGTHGHETQHTVFSGLKQKYGKEAGFRIIAQTLAALNPIEHKHLKDITDWRIQNRYDPIKEPEERIAHLQNYLQDSMWRKSAHKHMRLRLPDDEQRAHSLAKDIWQKLHLRAQSLGPEHIGVVRKAEDDIKTWVLSKSEPDLDYNVYEDQMGLTPRSEAFLEAAKFLGHTNPDEALFRQCLLADKDLIEAALIAVGLDVNDENRRSIESIVKLQSKELKKADKTHEVLALMPDGAEVAEGVRRGFGANTEEELHLGGKHSAGAMMVRDPESGQMYLLKPGSNGQSPAKGAKEERANQSRREACYWHVAEAWGLNQRVPRADLLLIDGKEVAVLHLLPFDWKNLEKLKFKDAGLPHKALEKYRQMGELHKWAILDFTAGNPDRHGQNLMVGPQKEDYPVALIDHGSAFAGSHFDPANDKNSFIPYYLRAWHAEGWSDLTPEQKLRAMPTVSGDTEKQLREWFHGINAAELESILHRYGIDPVPTVTRLAKVKALLAEPNFSEAINRLWLIT